MKVELNENNNTVIIECENGRRFNITEKDGEIILMSASRLSTNLIVLPLATNAIIIDESRGLIL